MSGEWQFSDSDYGGSDEGSHYIHPQKIKKEVRCKDFFISDLHRVEDCKECQRLMRENR